MSSKLFKEFPEISSREWKDKVTSDLKGADFEKKLVWRTSEGFNVLPYYLEEDTASLKNKQANTSEFPYIRGSKKDNNWMIRQNFTVSEQVEDANKNALEALEKGAGAVGFHLSEAVVQAKTLFAALLPGISLDDTCVHFTGVENPVAFYKLLCEYMDSEELDPSSLKGSMGVDPLGNLSLNGEEDKLSTEALSQLVLKAAGLTPYFRIVAVNPCLFQDGGASLTQELGFGLSMANEYMDQLTSHGCSAEQAMRTMMFSFASGPNYFMEIAKLRAARWLWSLICKEWNIPEEHIKMTIHSQTAKWNLTLYDPYVNVLRSTTEAMSASLAGADVISVHPHDTVYNQENEFSGRIGRNLQIILKEEAYIDKVGDPAAGSYYIETLTDQIAEQAWLIFQEVEKAGGYTEAFKQGIIQDNVAESLTAKKERAAARKLSILGVNQYPNFNEMVLDQVVNQAETAEEGGKSFRSIGQFRIAEDFEALRLQTEKSGKRPKVFLLKYGDPVWMTARAMFAGNFFAVAGYEIIDSPGFDTLEEGIDAARKTGAEIVVLCSSDGAYAEIGKTVYEAMQNTSETVIAGYPKDCIIDLQGAGLKHFIHMRSNLLETLREFNSIMGLQ